MKKTVLAGLCAALLAACANTSAPEKERTATDLSTKYYAPGARGGVASADDTMVCRLDRPTGSHQPAWRCISKEEEERLKKENEAAFDALLRKNRHSSNKDP